MSMKRIRHREFFLFTVIVSGLSVLLFGSQPQLQANNGQAERGRPSINLSVN